MATPTTGQPLRICMVADHHVPVREPFAGGLELTWHLARELVRRGHEVSVFAAPGSGGHLGVVELTVDGLPDHPGRLDAGAPAAVEVAEHHAYLALMLGVARAENPRFDVLHNNSLHYLPVAMAPALQIPMLTTLHTQPLRRLESAVQLDGGCSSFAAVSRFTAESWSPIVDCVCVPHGVDLLRWPAGRGGDTAVWSGRLVADKAPHEAIMAARHAEIPINLAGPILDMDYFQSAVKPLLGPDATYVGHLDQVDLADLVGRSAVAVVTPAWDEPYGLVAAEALSCGTPVAAYARGDLPEVVTPGTGRLATPGDTGMLGLAIQAASRLDRGRCRQHAAKNLSLGRMVDLYEGIYADLVTQKQAA